MIHSTLDLLIKTINLTAGQTMSLPLIEREFINRTCHQFFFAKEKIDFEHEGCFKLRG